MKPDAITKKFEIQLAAMKGCAVNELSKLSVTHPFCEAFDEIVPHQP